LPGDLKIYVVVVAAALSLDFMSSITLQLDG
jgi:hypothetical protein